MTQKLTEVKGIGEETAAMLASHGFQSVEALTKASAEQLAQVPGFGAARASAVIQAAMELLTTLPAPVEAQTPTTKKSSKKKAKKSQSSKKAKGKASKKKPTKKKEKKKSKSKKKK